MNLQHEYGILLTAELITLNPDKWDNGTLNKFIDAAFRFSTVNGKRIQLPQVLKNGIYSANTQLSKSK